MTLRTKKQTCKIKGVNDFLEKLDITEEEKQEAQKDSYTEFNDLVEELGLHEAMSIVLDNREEEYIITRMSNYKPHFKVIQI